MAASDSMALEANFKKWTETRGVGLTGVAPFNYYVMESFLKDFPINDAEIRNGIVDKSGDGGVDAFYFFANKKYVFDDTFLDKDFEYNFDLVIFQCKEGSGFSPIEMGKFVFFADDLLDPKRSPSKYKDSYHDQLKVLMATFKKQFARLAGSFISITITFYYVTKLDLLQPDTDTAIKEKETRISETIKSHFSNAIFRFDYVNAEKLWSQIQHRKRHVKTLTYSNSFTQVGDSWIALVDLPSFFKFLQDDNGHFHEQLMEENVRGFQKKTSVNEGIIATLSAPDESAEFWQLNNGITIVASNVIPAHQSVFTITDPQIVNGLQTSRQVFDYYKSDAVKPNPDTRKLLVRIIKTKSDGIRDQIINATNSQNLMPAEALRATDRIQRKLEDVFLDHGLFYDRRKGHYKDLGKPAKQIVSIREALQASLAVILRRPDAARARPSDYLKANAKYDEVYKNEKIPLTAHVKSVQILRMIESFGASSDYKKRLLDLQFYASYILAARALKNSHVPAKALGELDAASIGESDVGQALHTANVAYEAFGANATASKSAGLRALVVGQMGAELHG